MPTRSRFLFSLLVLPFALSMTPSLSGEPGQTATPLSLELPAVDLTWLMPFGARGQQLSGRESHTAGGMRDASGSRLIGHGLAELAAKQGSDGSWHAAEPHSEYDLGVTALAVLAFLGAGYCPNGPAPYATVVSRGLGALVASQDENGCIGRREADRYKYVHAFGTLALVEWAAMAPDVEAIGRAQRAIEFAEGLRAPYSGWRGVSADTRDLKLGTRDSADTTITGCMAMAVVTALTVNRKAIAAGLNPPFSIHEGSPAGARFWMDRMTDPVSGRVGYVDRGGGAALPDGRPPPEGADPSASPGDANTAIGAWALQATRGWGPPADAEIPTARMIGRLIGRPPSAEAVDVDLFGWFFGGLALSRVASKEAANWYMRLGEAMNVSLGTTPKSAQFRQNDRWTSVGGDVYAVAMSVLALESAWRYESPEDGSDLIQLARRAEAGPWLRVKAIHALSLLASVAESDSGRHAVVAGLREAISGRDPEVRRAGAAALARVATEVDAAVLTIGLNDPDEEVAFASAVGLSRAGVAGVTPLSQALAFPSARMRAIALDGLSKFGSAAAASVVAARALLNDPVSAVRVRAAKCLWSVSGNPDGGLPVLIAALSDVDLTVRRAALGVLLTKGRSSAPAEAAIRARLVDSVPDIRLTAVLALFAATGIVDVSAPIDMLRDADPANRVLAIHTLASLGRKAIAAKASLEVALRDPDRSVHDAAADALIKLNSMK